MCDSKSNTLQVLFDAQSQIVLSLFLNFDKKPGSCSCKIVPYIRKSVIQNLEEFRNFARLLMVFLEFRSKFTKFLRNFMDF